MALILLNVCLLLRLLEHPYNMAAGPPPLQSMGEMKIEALILSVKLQSHRPSHLLYFIDHFPIQSMRILHKGVTARVGDLWQRSCRLTTKRIMY